VDFFDADRLAGKDGAEVDFFTSQADAAAARDHDDLVASAMDLFPVTPALVTNGNWVLGVLYGANGMDLLSATDSIFARWLQKKVVITDSSTAQLPMQGGYGPSRQWFTPAQSAPQTVTVTVYAEDGVIPLGVGVVTLREAGHTSWLSEAQARAGAKKAPLPPFQLGILPVPLLHPCSLIQF